MDLPAPCRVATHNKQTCIRTRYLLNICDRINDAVLVVQHAASHHVVMVQVLRDLGISEARLQNSLVEVWNKTDLLPPHVDAAAVTGRHTAAVAGQRSQSDDDTPGTSNMTNMGCNWSCYVALLGIRVPVSSIFFASSACLFSHA